MSKTFFISEVLDYELGREQILQIPQSVNV